MTIKKPTVIAELGINHNGDLDILMRLADMALRSGVDYIKLQTRTPRICVPKSQWAKPRRWFDGSLTSYIEYKELMEFSVEDLKIFDNYIREQYGERRWFSSVWDVEALLKISKFDFDFIKIPSAKITDTRLMEAAIDYADSNDITFMFSTGMSTSEEVTSVRRLLGGRNFRVPHLRVLPMACNSSYPTEDTEADLGTIPTLEKMFWGKAGYSSHNPSPFPVLYAMALGASAVEFHVTLGRHMQGTDHGASIEKAGVELICREAERIPLLMGDGRIRVYESEMPARSKLRG